MFQYVLDNCTWILIPFALFVFYCNLAESLESSDSGPLSIPPEKKCIETAESACNRLAIDLKSIPSAHDPNRMIIQCAAGACSRVSPIFERLLATVLARRIRLEDLSVGFQDHRTWGTAAILERCKHFEWNNLVLRYEFQMLKKIVLNALMNFVQSARFAFCPWPDSPDLLVWLRSPDLAVFAFYSIRSCKTILVMDSNNMDSIIRNASN